MAKREMAPAASAPEQAKKRNLPPVLPERKSALIMDETGRVERLDETRALVTLSEANTYARDRFAALSEEFAKRRAEGKPIGDIYKEGTKLREFSRSLDERINDPELRKQVEAGKDIMIENPMYVPPEELDESDLAEELEVLNESDEVKEDVELTNMKNRLALYMRNRDELMAQLKGGSDRAEEERQTRHRELESHGVYTETGDVVVDAIGRRSKRERQSVTQLLEPILETIDDLKEKIAKRERKEGDGAHVKRELVNLRNRLGLYTQNRDDLMAQLRSSLERTQAERDVRHRELESQGVYSEVGDVVIDALDRRSKRERQNITQLLEPILDSIDDIQEKIAEKEEELESYGQGARGAKVTKFEDIAKRRKDESHDRRNAA